MPGEVRILCVGTGDRLTSPVSLRIDSRGYRYAKPGKAYHYGGYSTSHEESDLPSVPLASAYPGGPKIQGYGLVVITDTYTRLLKTPAESSGFIEPNTFEEKIIQAKERVLALEQRWHQPFPKMDYGALIIAGEMPTAQELGLARENRERNAKSRLSEAINDQNLASHGHQARQRGYTKAQEAWAFEFGVILPLTVDSMEHREEAREMKKCPDCANLIFAEANVCIHCKLRFDAPPHVLGKQKAEARA